MLLFDSKTNPEDKMFVEVYTIPGSNLERKSVCYENLEDLLKNYSSSELKRLEHHGLTPSKVKAQRVWASDGLLFYQPYLGDNDVKKNETLQDSANGNTLFDDTESVNHSDNYKLDLEGDDKTQWRYSYLKNKRQEKGKKDLDLISYKINKLLNEHKLYFNPDIGFIRNKRLIEKADKDANELTTSSYPLKLIHYSKFSGLRSIDPNFMRSTEKFDNQNFLPEIKMSSFLLNDLPSDHSANGDVSKYILHLQPHQKLYDIDKDKDMIIDSVLDDNNNIWDTDKILNKIKECGHHGIWAPNSNNQNVKNLVQLFYSQKPEIEEVL